MESFESFEDPWSGRSEEMTSDELPEFDEDEVDEQPEIARPAATTTARMVSLRDIFSLPEVTMGGKSPEAIR